jgi:hypothetical protein
MMANNDAIREARRLETLFRVPTDRVEGSTGEAAALQIEVANLDATYWVWPDPHSLTDWEGRKVVGNDVLDIEPDLETVAHRMDHGETTERVSRIEVPAPDVQRYQLPPESTVPRAVAIRASSEGGDDGSRRPRPRRAHRGPRGRRRL